jgi:hypothetical protein
VSDNAEDFKQGAKISKGSILHQYLSPDARCVKIGGE